MCRCVHHVCVGVCISVCRCVHHVCVGVCIRYVWVCASVHGRYVKGSLLEYPQVSGERQLQSGSALHLSREWNVGH